MYTKVVDYQKAYPNTYKIQRQIISVKGDDLQRESSFIFHVFQNTVGMHIAMVIGIDKVGSGYGHTKNEAVLMAINNFHNGEI